MPDVTQYVEAAKKTGNLAYLFRFPVELNNVTKSGREAATFVSKAIRMLDVRPTSIPLYDADIGDDVMVITVEDVPLRGEPGGLEQVQNFRENCEQAGTIGILIIFEAPDDPDEQTMTVEAMVETTSMFDVALGATPVVCVIQEPDDMTKKGVWVGHVRGYCEVYGD